MRAPARSTAWLAAAGLLAAGAMAAVVCQGRARWVAGTHRLRARLQATRSAAVPPVYGRHELQGLPAPVQRYFRAVLTDGQPRVAAVALAQRGEFNLSATGARWRPFTASQHVVLQPPGFVWDARVHMLPGLPVHVVDAYVAGEGRLHAAVLGLLPVADLHRTPGLARGELMRWFAEAVWYPTALLPSLGVRWQAVDDHAARATLTHGGITLSLLFHFGDDGLIDTVRADARERVVDGVVTTAPWQGRFWNYALRDGMRVPLHGEVGWDLPQGLQLYCRATTTALAYTLHGSPWPTPSLKPATRDLACQPLPPGL